MCLKKLPLLTVNRKDGKISFLLESTAIFINLQFRCTYLPFTIVHQTTELQVYKVKICSTPKPRCVEKSIVMICAIGSYQSTFVNLIFSLKEYDTWVSPRLNEHSINVVAMIMSCQISKIDVQVLLFIFFDPNDT